MLLFGGTSSSSVGGADGRRGRSGFCGWCGAGGGLFDGGGWWRLDHEEVRCLDDLAFSLVSVVDGNRPWFCQFGIDGPAQSAHNHCSLGPWHLLPSVHCTVSHARWYMWNDNVPIVRCARRTQSVLTRNELLLLTCIYTTSNVIVKPDVVHRDILVTVSRVVFVGNVEIRRIVVFPVVHLLIVY
jgi:hypothetical protein